MRIIYLFQIMLQVGVVTYIVAFISVFTASVVSFYTIYLHLKNYRRPDLQRLSIRIILMVPIYGISSLAAITFKGSFFIQTIRDIYEGFVIYSFFALLINYLDGERALLVLLQNRLSVHHLWLYKTN